MERKLVKQGNDKNRSFTTTLPIQWIKNNDLENNLKINLEIIDNKILISSKELKDETTTINAKNIDFILQKIIAEKYKLGLNEILIRFEKIETLDLIRNVVEKELIGFEIFEQTKTKCKICDVTKEGIEKFEKTLERSLHTLSTITDETIKALKEDDRSYLKRLIAKDKDLNKLVFFCERQLNKKSQEYHGKIQFYFFLLERIENIGDTNKGIINFYLDQKNKMQDSTIKVLEEINKRIKEFNKIIFTKQISYEEIKEFFEKLQKTRNKLLQLYSPRNKDIKYLYYMGSMIQFLKGAIRATYTLK